MRGIWIFFVIILVLTTAGFAIVWLAGMNIPEKHDITREFEIQESPHTIWYLLADYAGYSNWREDIRFLVTLPPTKMDSLHSWREYEMNGHNISYVMVESSFPRYIAFETLDDGEDPIGRWDISISKMEDGCAVSIRERGISEGPFHRFSKKYLNRAKLKADVISRSIQERYQHPEEEKRVTIWN